MSPHSFEQFFAQQESMAEPSALPCGCCASHAAMHCSGVCVPPLLVDVLLVDDDDDDDVLDPPLLDDALPPSAKVPLLDDVLDPPLLEQAASERSKRTALPICAILTQSIRDNARRDLG